MQLLKDGVTNGSTDDSGYKPTCHRDVTRFRNARSARTCSRKRVRREDLSKYEFTTRVGTDIGGTFTDFVYLNTATGKVTLDKQLTTPEDPSKAVISGLDKQEAASPVLQSTSDITHGTTLVINALIERKGSKTALLTTAGFEDALEIRREVRYDAYDLNLTFPSPLTPRRRRLGVSGRVHTSGEEIEPLDIEATKALIDGLIEDGVESVAVCLLHSYANDEHERVIEELVNARDSSVHVSLSSQVLPEVREYERTSTTVANAYTQPLVESYLQRLDEALKEREFLGKLYVMQSAGGVLPLESAARFPVRMVESGPAGGVIAAIAVGERLGLEDLLAFDMGGTTAKICPVVAGAAAVTHNYEVARTAHFRAGSGIPVSTPVMDLLEIGTGGGSIAHIDSLDLLKVGPESAGSVPGPAAYGGGGDRPTVTDADVVLGYLDPANFLGGEMKLDADAAVRTLERLGRRLSMSAIETAHAIREAAEEDMAAAARVHLAGLGLDPTSLPLVAYGGAGPVHAVGLASRLGTSRVIVPPAAGVSSALGLIVAPATFETSQTYKVKSERIDLREVDRLYRYMEGFAASMLPPLADGQEVKFARWVDMRYVGQGFEVSIDLPPNGGLNSISTSRLNEDFRDAYESRFGRSYDDVTVETVNLRVRATISGESQQLGLVSLTSSKSTMRESPSAIRKAYFAGYDRPLECPVYARNLLGPESDIRGPAIIQERETTTVVSPGARAGVGELGALVIDL